MESKAQYGQDTFILNLFKNKTNRIFVDIGAYNGLTFSNTYIMEKDFGWKGICIEPNPKVFSDLKLHRDCICLNCCVATQKRIVDFVAITGWGEMLSGIKAFFSDDHIKRVEDTIQAKGGTITEIPIECLPLSDILEQHNITEIDYCNIDVEGGELEVLNSIDFSKVAIKYFSIENNYGTSDVRRFLGKQGYSLIGKCGQDEIFEMNSRRYAMIFFHKWREMKFAIAAFFRSRG